MFLPIGDTPKPRHYTPWMTWALIAANVAVYLFINLPLSGQPVDPHNPHLAEYLRWLAPSLPPSTSLHQVLSQLNAYDLFTFVHGYKPGAPSVSDLFVSLFLHAGFLHLAGNMLFLGIFGTNVEHRLGRAVYLLTYLVAGALGTLTFSLLAIGSMTPLIGASGAISGVLGVYFLLFPRNKVKLFVFLFIYIDIWLLPVRWVLGFFVLIDNLLPLLLGSGSNVAFGAHLGGFAFGLGLAWLIERLGWRLPRGQRRVEPPVIDPGQVDEQAMARLHLEMGLQRLGQGQPTAAYQHLLQVFDFQPDPHTAARARAALAQIDAYRRR